METGTVSEFMEKWDITGFITRVNSRPDGLMSDSKNHWKVVFHSDKTGRSMSVYFSGGSAVTRINLVEVLDCLASDACGLENSPKLADWASDYGYNNSVELAVKTYNAVKHQTARLKRFLTNNKYCSPLIAFRELLNTERL
jgi:hypothetical protein